jgi:hypothetical protein
MSDDIRNGDRVRHRADGREGVVTSTVTLDSDVVEVTVQWDGAVQRGDMADMLPPSQLEVLKRDEH